MKQIVRLLAILAVVMQFCVFALPQQRNLSVVDSPIVKSGDMPLYPPLARQARLQGTVTLEVTTDGNAITNVSATGAHKILLEAAEQNIRTWRFYPHKPQTFRVTFVYKLESEEVGGFVNPRVLLNLPHLVEVHSKSATVETMEAR